jgi:hypothetical protein
LEFWLSPLLISIQNDPDTFANSSADDNVLKKKVQDLCKVLIAKIELSLELSRLKTINIQNGLVKLDENSTLPWAIRVVLQLVKEKCFPQSSSISHNELIELLANESIHSQLFYSSCSAIFFLRLICPALISPNEWGLLKLWVSTKVSKSDLPEEIVFLETKTCGDNKRDIAKESNHCHIRFLQSVSAIVVISHILTSEDILSPNITMDSQLLPSSLNKLVYLSDSSMTILQLMQTISSEISLKLVIQQLILSVLVICICRISYVLD